ncbi:DUF3768 domain-containing protein [Bosea caraganae]|uniref:DUF3768 domain-containing protein n=1 Tax=Bosea caraganae TaxID=2763117 RepID=A0A370L180_9HYPH|nr:DUF3768 domain-containing protein [Bosea caraganae]RDJ21075.1 DUF3768 domain-containing protein [Bosea caraganae]RDJ28574.1 DUF3768 domain-containing protein [Bosea caraganae]
MSLHPSTIAGQNDAFRSMIHIPQFGTPKIPGKWLITPGITALPPVAQIEIIAEVRNFDAFTEDNDPYGEHDFGAFEHPGAGKIFWKIDYYDRALTGGSPDPADPSVTCRVLTIMLAQEY